MVNGDWKRIAIVDGWELSQTTLSDSLFVYAIYSTKCGCAGFWNIEEDKWVMVGSLCKWQMESPHFPTDKVTMAIILREFNGA